MKVSSSKLRVAMGNSFISINSICLLIGKVLAMVYNLYLSFQVVKLTLTLLKVRNDIPKVIFILMLANRKVLLKNQDFSFLLSSKKKTITILKLFSLLPSIFWAPTSVFQTWKLNFLIKLSVLY